MNVRVLFRNPYPPHSIIAEVQPADVTYGFVLNRKTTASFSLSTDAALLLANPTIFGRGTMVTIERDDKLLPWAGFVSTRRLKHGAPTIPYTCQDWAGALYERAVTSKATSALPVQRAGGIVPLVFAESDARKEPPLLTVLNGSPAAGGTVSYTPRQESVLEFLRVMSEAGLEWRIQPYIVGNNVHVELQYSDTVGRDLSSSVIFEQGSGDGSSFIDADLEETDEGAFSAAVAVVGTGVYAQRKSARVSAQTLPGGDTAAYPSGKAAPASPSLAGTKVVVRQELDNVEGARAVAARQFRSPDAPGLRMTMQLFEANIDMAKIELGSYYGVRFKDLMFGLGYRSRIRAVALDLSTDGVITMIGEMS